MIVQNKLKYCLIYKSQIESFHFLSVSTSEKQRELEAIRERLAAQLKQKMDDEDERIRDAVREAEEKRAKEEAEKDGKMRKVIQEQAEHRHMQVQCCPYTCI